MRYLPVWTLAASLIALPAAAQPTFAAPDFSGLWAHLSLPGFEPPISGPGPIRNKMRRPDGVGDFNRLVGDYTNPILKPEAAAIVK